MQIEKSKALCAGRRCARKLNKKENVLQNDDLFSILFWRLALRSPDAQIALKRQTQSARVDDQGLAKALPSSKKTAILKRGTLDNT